MWNEKENNICISRVIRSHMGLVYIETLYFIISRGINSHMGPMYTETPYIIISSRGINSHLGCLYTETPYTWGGLSFPLTWWIGNLRSDATLMPLGRFKTFLVASKWHHFSAWHLAGLVSGWWLPGLRRPFPQVLPALQNWVYCSVAQKRNANVTDHFLVMLYMSFYLWVAPHYKMTLCHILPSWKLS